jgi:large subunit ribosomal protein L3
VPGSKGGWVMIRDAVKKPHKDLPMPASVKKRSATAAALADAPVAEQQTEA